MPAAPRSVLPLVLLAAVAVTACGGDGPTQPPPGEASASLVIAPRALLLPTAGDTQQLKAYAVDAHGDTTEVSATFESSAPGIVTVSATGLATAGAALGSAHIIARSGDLVSAPILVLRATPAPGALLVRDDQVIAIEPADSAAPYQSGWRYRVRLRAVTQAPTVGQVMLASGGAPVGGRVVDVATAGGDLDVVLEVVPVSEMFTALSVNERLPLQHAALVLPDASRAGLRLERRLDGSIAGSATHPAFSAAQVGETFDLGPFSCKAEAMTTVFPASINDYSFDVDFDLVYDVVFESTFQHALVTGSIAPRLTASPRITAELEGKAECKFHFATLHLPIGGPLALVVGGQVPLGVGFGIGGKVAFGPVGYDALIQASVAATFGLDCAAGCQVVTSITSTEPQKYFKLVMPALTDLADATRIELAMSAFGYAELAIGNGFFEWAQFKAVGLKAGLEQKAELASQHAQAADPAYASSFSLTPVLEAKAEASLEAIANLLNINLATLTFAPTLPILARSPQGTLTITPASVAPGNGTQLGERATFTVTLSDVTYLGAYAVEGIEIRWRKSNGTTTTLEPGRPGCTDLEAAQDQVSFSCQTDFLEADAGAQTFYAFVKTRIFGVPIPVPLEIAPDARAVVTVGEPALLEWTFDTDNDGWEEGVIGDGTVFQLDREGGVLKLHGTDDAVGTPNAWIYRQVALPANARTIFLRVSAHNRDQATVAWRLRLVDAGGVSHTLADWEVLSGAEGVFLWVNRTASVAAWAGSMVTLFVEQDDNGEHNHEHFYITEIRITD